MPWKLFVQEVSVSPVERVAVVVLRGDEISRSRALSPMAHGLVVNVVGSLWGWIVAWVAK